MERNSGADAAAGSSAGLGGIASDQQLQGPFTATPADLAAAMDADLQGTAMEAAAAAGGGPVLVDLPDSASEVAAADDDDSQMLDDGESDEQPMPADAAAEAAAALAELVQASGGALDMDLLLDLLQQAADEHAEAAEAEAHAQLMEAFWQRVGAVLTQFAALQHWRRQLKARVRHLRQRQMNYLQQQLAQPPLAPALAVKYRVTYGYPNAAAAGAAAAAAAAGAADLVARTHALSVEYAAYQQQEVMMQGEMAQLVQDLHVELDRLLQNIDLVEQHPELLDAAHPALADLEPAALMNALHAVLGIDAAAAIGDVGGQ